jgi:hypothetical protein
MSPLPSFLQTLKSAADNASAAEGTFHREVTERIKKLEQERAFAFRRLNLMQSIAGAVATTEDQAVAVANSLALLRSELGWDEISDSRSAILSRFAPVAGAVFANLTPPNGDAGHAPSPDAEVINALADFERWYAASYPTPFWALFDRYVPEMPLVER